ncbi:MAG: hypothetical protein QXX29_05025 [Nitrososphaerota archaeon]
MRRLIRIALLSFTFPLLLSAYIFESGWFFNTFFKVTRDYPLTFTMIFLHNTWTGFVILLAFYLTACLMREINPRIIEMDPVFKHPRLSSLLLSAFIVLFSGLKGSPIGLLHINIRILLPISIIAALEIYGTYCLVQMSLKMKFEVDGVLRAILAFLCGALIEAAFIILIEESCALIIPLPSALLLK